MKGTSHIFVWLRVKETKRKGKQDIKHYLQLALFCDWLTMTLCDSWPYVGQGTLTLNGLDLQNH